MSAFPCPWTTFYAAAQSRVRIRRAAVSLSFYRLLILSAWYMSMKWFETIARDMMGCTLAWFVLGVCLFSGSLSLAGDCVKAKTLYRRAEREVNYAARLPIYREAVRLCPEFAEAWNNLADTEENLGRLDDAMTHYQRALSLNPNLAVSHFSLGDIYLRRREFKDACREYIAGLKIRPDDELALKNLHAAEAAFQAAGGVLPAEYITYRLGDIRHMGVGGTRARMTFQNILFDFDSAKIKLESYAQLNAIGSALRDLFERSNVRVLIEGHTDNTGNPDYNTDLSRRRAESVRQFLISNFWMSADRLTIRGYGLTRPVCTNATAEGRAKNRRVEITLLE